MQNPFRFDSIKLNKKKGVLTMQNSNISDSVSVIIWLIKKDSNPEKLLDYTYYKSMGSNLKPTLLLSHPKSEIGPIKLLWKFLFLSIFLYLSLIILSTNCYFFNYFFKQFFWIWKEYLKKRSFVELMPNDALSKPLLEGKFENEYKSHAQL